VATAGSFLTTALASFAGMDLASYDTHDVEIVDYH
jgi:hypothetical protein